MLNSTKQKKIFRDFIEIKGDRHQLNVFISVALGLKPVIDDWITKFKLPAYIKMCHKYGLEIGIDMALYDIDNLDLKKSVGGETLTTTIARGILPELADSNDVIHVFVGRKKENIKKALANGWYPLEIGGRIIQKPYIDLLKFGYDLGYPECCVKFFRRYNDWSKYSHLYEIYKNTKGEPSFLCNCLAKAYHGYIYHMPCSFNCLETKKIVSTIRERMMQESSDLVAETDKFLKKPYLVLYEDKVYAFDGELKNKILSYKKVFFVAKASVHNIYQKILEKGDSLKVIKDNVIILKSNRQIAVIKPDKNNINLQKPFLIQFK